MDLKPSEHASFKALERAFGEAMRPDQSNPAAARAVSGDQGLFALLGHCLDRVQELEGQIADLNESLAGYQKKRGPRKAS